MRNQLGHDKKAETLSLGFLHRGAISFNPRQPDAAVGPSAAPNTNVVPIIAAANN
jgi:hypothetical protein